MTSVCRVRDNADFVGVQTHSPWSSRPAAKLAEIPVPPARPVELTQTAGAIAVQAPGQLIGEPLLAEAAQAVPLPARRPPDAALSAVHRAARVALPKIITGAQCLCGHRPMFNGLGAT
ncbi:MAG TPA: hypothetical protein VGP28_08230 [Methylocella sp.]|nr:hypothetical protein [Methylocella sp.]